ncbi:MAG: acyl-CoA dehydrogenase family protein [Bacteroidetes Order II. Incertae sedis bacterium]|nr:acyl-CoA dehydrogenase family protein [Bacteroidetes Order II. bacterium]
MSQLSNLQNLSKKDRDMIRETEQMMGPEPSEMGFIKNLFWGRFRSDLVLPYPAENAYEKETLAALLRDVTAYMTHEHPAKEIDQNEEIPKWCIDRLFQIGVMGMTIPKEYGGLGLGVTAYNRVLSVIGARCAATSVVVSAHQSIGCKALILYGTESQKQRYLPMMAREKLSAFCLSEPNVGCDAGGQETTCVWNAERQVYVLNGEKKWSTSGAIAGLFTVLARQSQPDGSDAITALIVTPDMRGVEVFEHNRSKAGVRGTWQARIRFNQVEVPLENLLHEEGKGLQVALSCLNYGRCTLSAGVTGAAIRGMNQAIKWSRTRYQFKRPLADFELIQQKIARMTARAYAMEAVLYLTTNMLDRKDPDIMVETAATKVFCSEMGNHILNDALQIMGGEGYITENELERAWRDARIYPIVEGANEVMLSFIYAYGSKQLSLQLLGIRDRLLWQKNQKTAQNLRRMTASFFKPTVWRTALPLGGEVILGLRKQKPEIPVKHHQLRPFADRLARLIPEHSYQVKKTGFVHQEKMVTRQALQARLAENAIYLFALSACVSKIEDQLEHPSHSATLDRDWAAFVHFFDLAEQAIQQNIQSLTENADHSMLLAAKAAIQYNDTLPNEGFVLPEKSPVLALSNAPLVADATSQAQHSPLVVAEVPTEESRLDPPKVLQLPVEIPQAIAPIPAPAPTKTTWQTTTLFTKKTTYPKSRTPKTSEVYHQIWQPAPNPIPLASEEQTTDLILQPILEATSSWPKEEPKTAKTVSTINFEPNLESTEGVSSGRSFGLDTSTENLSERLEWVDKPIPEMVSASADPEWV